MKTDTEKEIVYQPGVTESKFTVKYLLETLEKNGTNSLQMIDTIELKNINQLMQQLDRSLEVEMGSVYIKDIVK
jgi:hypothetical protein